MNTVPGKLHMKDQGVRAFQSGTTLAAGLKNRSSHSRAQCNAGMPEVREVRQVSKGPGLPLQLPGTQQNTVSSRREARDRDSLQIAAARGDLMSVQALLLRGAPVETRTAHATLKIAVLKNQPSLTSVMLTTLKGKVEADVLVEHQFRKALKRNAGSATIDLLAQHIAPICLDAGDERILAGADTLIPALARQLSKEATRPDGRQDWCGSTRWLCRERGLRHLVVKAMLADMPPARALLEEIDADCPVRMSRPPHLLRQLLCARMLADNRSLRSLRDDSRGALEEYVGAARQSRRADQRLDREVVRPLASEARAQAALLMKLGRQFCEAGCRQRIFQLPSMLARLRGSDAAEMAGHLCSRAGLMPPLAVEIARVWLLVRDAPAASSGHGNGVGSDALLARFARQMLHTMRCSAFREMLQAPRSRPVRGLLASQAVHITEFCGKVLGARPAAR